MGLLKAAMRSAQFTSYDALGKVLCERYPELKWPKARSLGAKLGQLDKGNIEWWNKRPEYVEKLAEVLECAHQDLGLHKEYNERHLYRFEDFPELPPLDLQRESPCELGSPDSGEKGSEVGLEPWFGLNQWGRITRPAGITWLFFPPGSGRDLFCEHLKSRSPFECINARTLADVTDRLERADPVCVNVTDSGGERDIQALAKLHKDGAVLICAPFPFNTQDTAPPQESGKLHDGLETPEACRKRKLTNPDYDAFDGGFDRYQWHLHTDWRSRLLSWVGHRLASHPDSVFDTKQLEHWLAGFNGGALFDSPRSLIAICRFAHRFGCWELPSADDQTAGETLLGLLHEHEHTDHNAFRRVIRDWLLEPGIPWNNWLPPQSWKAFVARHEDEIELGDQLVNEQDPRRRAEIWGELKHHLERPRYDGLIESEFMLQNERGEVRLSPPFLTNLLARDQLYQIILSESHDRWGQLCFDRERIDLVNQALALLTLDELSSVAIRVLESNQEDAGSVGATEAIFCAVGLMPTRPETLPTSLVKIAMIVLSRMMNVDETEPRPWSAISGDAQLWVSICWMWSIALAHAPVDLPEQWASFFPGWCDPGRQIDWGWSIPQPDPQQANSTVAGLPSSERALLYSAERVAAHLAVQSDSAPEVMHPYLIARGIGQGWTVPPQWWQTVMSYLWAQELLSEQLKGPDQPLTPWLLSMHQSLLLLHQSDDDDKEKKTPIHPLLSFLLRGGALSTELFSRSVPEDFLRQVGTDGIRLYYRYFSILPRAYQIRLLAKFRDHFGVMDWFWLREMLTPDFAESVIPWIEEDPALGGLVAEWLWNICPDKAERLLKDTSSQAVQSSLIRHQESPEMLECVLDVLEENRKALSAEELTPWVLERIPNSKRFASRLIALISQEK